MLKRNDKILIFWNSEGLEPNQANGHYQNEKEIITINRIDHEFYYDDNSYVEVEKDNIFINLQDDLYIRQQDLYLLERVENNENTNNK
tara:strand:+ start:268 stop:531 length:264 start_codon:yes stop_codon:yes gene_type:complete